MGINKSTFLRQIDEDLKGIPTDEFSGDAREAQLDAALERYNKDRPREDTIDLSGDGGNYYEITATDFTLWVEGFSRILSIQYPAADVAADEEPTHLEDDDWEDDYWASGKRYLYLPNHTPSASEAMRIKYTAPYVWAASTDEELSIEVPAQDFHALCHLAAGLCCGKLAVKYGQSIDPTIGADVVNYAQKSDFYSRRSEELIALYEKHLGIQEGTAPASAVGEWDVEEIYLFHGRKTR